MSLFDNLASLGKGYSLIGAIVSTLIGVIMIVIGNKIRTNHDDISRQGTGTTMMIAGAIIIAVGIGMYYLAQANKDVAAVAGVWLVVMVLVTIIGAFKGNDNLVVSLE